MIVPATILSMIILACITLMYAAICDHRTFTIPITVWVPVIVWGIIIWVAEYTLIGMIITGLTIIIVSIPALFGKYGGADAIAFSVAAFTAPLMIGGLIPVGLAVWFTALAVWMIHHRTQNRDRYPYIIYIAPAYIVSVTLAILWRLFQ